MNPFSQNPVTFLDECGLAVSARMIRFGYRRLRISPVLLRSLPKAAFIAAALTTAAVNPHVRMPLIILAMFSTALLSIRLAGESAAIRDKWNARLYRTYSALAIAEREKFFFRQVIVVAVAACLTMGVSICIAARVPVAAAFLCFLALQLSVVFGYWMDAAELPEPDEGDLVAQPQPT